MKPNLLTDKKVIITAAITGGIHGKWANPALPLTAEEQAQSALECYEAGASIVHIHVRGDDGQNTPDLTYYGKTVRKIGEKCPLIRQIGNGIGARVVEHHFTTKSGIKRMTTEIVQPTLEERLNLLNIETAPEMHTINAGSFEFRTPYGGDLFQNPQEFNRKYIKRCNKKGFGIEIEVYDSSHITNVLEFLETGLLKPPLHFSLVLGIKGGAEANPANLLHMVDQIPEGSTWQVVTVGKFNLRTTVMAMCMGGNIRTGLEDTIYYQKGELAQGNAQLVKRMVRIANEIGREVATVDEAKKMLGMKN
ncbi:MAG: 3-keto-5-aminohexanoate cleavage protein [Candidatus Lokiarchaeota archaeon]|nr:3-keto-5-aminohexanoate cleavage protein [Candidatus Lokiarchaeota archaeon]